MSEDPQDVINEMVSTGVFSDKVTMGLARELASELSSAEDVLEKFGVTPEQFKKIAGTPLFKQMYQEAKALWHSNTNAVDRIRAKTTMAAEDLILDAYKRAADPATSNDSFAKLWKLIIDSSTAAPVKGQEEIAKDKFTINIVLGEDKQVISGSATTETVVEGDFVEVGSE